VQRAVIRISEQPYPRIALFLMPDYVSGSKLENGSGGKRNLFCWIFQASSFETAHARKFSTVKGFIERDPLLIRRAFQVKSFGFHSRNGKWHRFCPQLIHIYYPMKRLQLWLLSACICCAALGQSANDHMGKIHIISPESNAAFGFFTVTPLNGEAVLRWSAMPVNSEDFFIVEKSSDALHFEVLSAMGANSGTDSVYSITDNAVGSGMVSYRIRISGKDGKELCSKTVNMNSVTAADFKFYPNPVDKLLIIRSSHALSIQIEDAYGIIKLVQNVDAGMQIVNVSSLQKGSYILKATDKATNTVISEQLVKNN